MTIIALLSLAKFNFFLTIINVIVIVCVAVYIMISPNIIVYWGSTTFSYGFTMLCVCICVLISIISMLGYHYNLMALNEKNFKKAYLILIPLVVSMIAFFSLSLRFFNLLNSIIDGRFSYGFLTIIKKASLEHKCERYIQALKDILDSTSDLSLKTYVSTKDIYNNIPMDRLATSSLNEVTSLAQNLVDNYRAEYIELLRRNSAHITSTMDYNYLKIAGIVIASAIILGVGIYYYGGLRSLGALTTEAQTNVTQAEAEVRQLVTTVTGLNISVEAVQKDLANIGAFIKQLAVKQQNSQALIENLRLQMEATKEININLFHNILPPVTDLTTLQLIKTFSSNAISFIGTYIKYT